jgi:molybdenum cofactor cytidylyltransferase
MVPAVVLAAGKSARMGRSKALLPIGHEGDTFLTRILRTLEEAGIEDVVVVLGHDAEAIESSVHARGLTPRIVLNREYESGQLSSLLAGLQVVDRPGVRAMLLMLVDAPLVSAATIRSVVERFRDSGARVVRPVRGPEHGHPVLIDKSLFDELRNADPSLGARSVVRRHASAAGEIHVNDDGAFSDIDTPEEYERLARHG